MNFKNLLLSANGIPTKGAIEDSGGRALIDPIGTSNPGLQKYSDFLGIIHKPGGIDYSTGLSLEQTQAKADADAQAKVDADVEGAYRASIGTFKPLKKGGSVKSSVSIRGGGIESRGKTKGRFV